MKKITLALAAAVFAAPAYADISTGNPDLYGWVVEDYGLQCWASGGPVVDSASPNGIAAGNPDLYGWATEDRALLSVPRTDYTATIKDAGIGDSYGSILHSVGFHW